MTSRMKALLSSVFLLGTLAAPLSALAAPLVERPIVIAHRGASGYLPEHTMEGYKLAVQMGADFIEPDLFLTSDGVLVARHDRSLTATTTGTGNVDQMTLAQVKALNADSRGGAGYATPAGSPYYEASDVFKVPTFTEVLDYVYELYLTTGQIVGIYPEVKQNPSASASTNTRAIADALLAAITDTKYGDFFDGHLNNIYLQSFDQATIQYLNTQTDLPLVFLTSCPSTAAAAAAIATYADGVGISRTAGASNKACVDRAHEAGLLVHVYTLTDNLAQHETVHDWGVDGVFGNHPDVTKSVRDERYPLPVPEPATAALFGAGLLGLAALRRRKAA